MYLHGNQKMEKTWHGKGIRNKDNSKNYWKLATWNIRGLSGKENELVEECRKAKVDILGITETKKKGQGTTDARNGYYLIYSGVPTNERAKAGVSCLVNEKWRKKILGWTYYWGHGKLGRCVIHLSKFPNHTLATHNQA
jgi:exonuclease III